MKHPNTTDPRRSRARGPVSPPPAPDVVDSAGTRVLKSLGELREAVNECRRCPLYRNATQGVPGEGASRAEIMLVGEQPGDVEDVQGHPFVGPAGAMLDRALDEAGVDRRKLFVTNAVKHFKFEQRGKRRLHMKPALPEIKACNWWLLEEMRLVEPRLVVALGATAARAVLGRTVTISAMRGAAVPLSETTHAWVTIHPSFLLRLPDEASRRGEYSRFVDELRKANEWLVKS